MEFKSFSKIERLSNVTMHITQKIHGSNAQVVITEDGTICAGSRNRWVTTSDDNFGFAAWVETNKEELIAKLGTGTHYGEWAGPGINSGEGLKVKTFILFGNPDNYKELPPQTALVPILYSGPLDTSKIAETLERLKHAGSHLVPGFMRPEGIVVQVGGVRWKVVFDAEETQWKSPDKLKTKDRPAKTPIDYNYLCQPLRLEKLLSRDERYRRDWPKSMPDLVKAYVADLIEEGQMTSEDTKAAGAQIFKFIRTTINNG